MKKFLVLAVLAISLVIFAVPVLAAPNENANPRAFLAQQINQCRDMMEQMVASGMMTKDQAKTCIESMKNGSCCCANMGNMANMCGMNTQ